VRLTRFTRDQRGAAAVEFAFVGTILAIVVGGMLSAWSAVSAVTDLKSAVKGGAVYVMNGGTDDSQIQAVSLAAWARRPADASVTVTRACTCAGAAHGCTSLCADGSVPMSFVTIRATTAADGLFAKFPLHEQQVIRVR
jgi:Flp pilus assembly protein TadG